MDTRGRIIISQPQNVIEVVNLKIDSSSRLNLHTHFEDEVLSRTAESITKLSCQASKYCTMIASFVYASPWKCINCLSEESTILTLSLHHSEHLTQTGSRLYVHSFVYTCTYHILSVVYKYNGRVPAR